MPVTVQRWAIRVGCRGRAVEGVFRPAARDAGRCRAVRRRRAQGRGRLAAAGRGRVPFPPAHPPEPLRAALLYARERELTDTLVDLLISTVHHIGARAERKVTKQLTDEFRRVTGKETMFARAAEAMVSNRDGTVRQVVFPVVDERTLRDVVAESKHSGPTYRRIVQTTLRASYTNHYRKGLIRLLEVLEFRSTNTAHQPVIQALGLVGRYAYAGNLTYYSLGERVPGLAVAVWCRKDVRSGRLAPTSPCEMHRWGAVVK